MQWRPVTLNLCDAFQYLHLNCAQGPVIEKHCPILAMRQVHPSLKEFYPRVSKTKTKAVHW